MRNLIICCVLSIFIGCASLTPYEPNYIETTDKEIETELKEIYPLATIRVDNGIYAIPDTTLDWNITFPWEDTKYYYGYGKCMDKAVYLMRNIKKHWPYDIPLVMGIAIIRTVDWPDNPTDEEMIEFLMTTQHAVVIIRYKDPKTIRLPVDGWMAYEYKYAKADLVFGLDIMSQPQSIPVITGRQDLYQIPMPNPDRIVEIIINK